MKSDKKSQSTSSQVKSGDNKSASTPTAGANKTAGNSAKVGGTNTTDPVGKTGAPANKR